MTRRCSDRGAVISGKTLDLMKKHVSTFPTDDEILTKYYEQKEWGNYKERLVQEIMEGKKRASSQFTYWCPSKSEK